MENQALKYAKRALDLALALEQEDHLSAGPARIALELARQILDAEIGAYVGSGVVEMALESGDTGVIALDRYIDEVLGAMAGQETERVRGARR